MPWQKKLDPVSRSKLVTEMKEVKDVFWLHVRAAKNRRDVECNVTGFGFDATVG
jgi:hypothetical protein